MADSDGVLLLDLMRKQQEGGPAYPLAERDRRQLARKRVVRTVSGEVKVEVPDGDEDDEVEAGPAIYQNARPSPGETEPEAEARQSIQVQAKLALIGAKMGFRIWVPAGDRGRVLELVPA